uniref:Uncharacterized protein n=1 Tax=Arion vulgaris TaxID=1028688 RepID=A0A0B6YIF9_9EUPU
MEIEEGEANLVPNKILFLSQEVSDRKVQTPQLALKTDRAHSVLRADSYYNQWKFDIKQEESFSKSLLLLL